MATSTPIKDAIPFLTDAAHLLRASAPETSAHLMRHCTELLEANSIPLPETQRQRCCGTCGHIMVPGEDGSWVNLERIGRRTKRSRAITAAPSTPSSSNSSQTLHKRVHCGRCRRTHSVKLDDGPKAARFRGQKKKISAEPTPVPVAESSASLKNKSNASSKKRAKNRKAGLQSILAAGQSQKGKSLSLSDFMK